MGFFLTMFMGGPLLGYLLLSLAGVDGWAMRLLPAISVLALVVSGVMSVMQGAELAIAAQAFIKQRLLLFD